MHSGILHNKINLPILHSGPSHPLEQTHFPFVGSQSPCSQWQVFVHFSPHLFIGQTEITAKSQTKSAKTKLYKDSIVTLLLERTEGKKNTVSTEVLVSNWIKKIEQVINVRRRPNTFFHLRPVSKMKEDDLIHLSFTAELVFKNSIYWDYIILVTI